MTQKQFALVKAISRELEAKHPQTIDELVENLKKRDDVVWTHAKRKPTDVYSKEAAVKSYITRDTAVFLLVGSGPEQLIYLRRLVEGSPRPKRSGPAEVVSMKDEEEAG